MAKRGKTSNRPAHYVVRDRHGKFKEWTGVGRSIPADATWDAKRKEPLSNPGYGHQADYPKKTTGSGRRVAKGFYKDKQGRTRPITGSQGVSRRSLAKAKQSKALSHPKKKRQVKKQPDKKESVDGPSTLRKEETSADSKEDSL